MGHRVTTRKPWVAHLLQMVVVCCSHWTRRSDNNFMRWKRAVEGWRW